MLLEDAPAYHPMSSTVVPRNAVETIDTNHTSFHHTIIYPRFTVVSSTFQDEEETDGVRHSMKGTKEDSTGDRDLEVCMIGSLSPPVTQIYIALCNECPIIMCLCPSPPPKQHQTGALTGLLLPPLLPGAEDEA